MQEQQQRREQIHRNQVKTAFSNYTKDMLQQHSYLFESVTSNQFYKHNQERKAIMMHQALKHNQIFLTNIIQHINYTQNQQDFQPCQVTTPNNRSKIKTTLKQFYREWCGQSKEKDDYSFIAQKCMKYLKKGDVVLVPGCGLGRLVFELVKRGLGAEGNELTYFMLFGSNFIINCSERKEQFKIFPFVHSTNYYYNEEDIYRSVVIPDIAPVQVLDQDPNFSIVGGEFTFIYNQRPEYFEGVATCFFLDTANNIFDYVDTIEKTLKEGGIWVNFGPLLYHYREMLDSVSVEVSWQTLRAYIIKKFVFIEQEFIKTTYCHDPLSDLSVQYNCISFVCRKAEKQEII